MRYKIMNVSPTHGETYTWSLGYPTKSSALSAARRLKSIGNPRGCRFTVEPMTAEDEALASKLEQDYDNA